MIATADTMFGPGFVWLVSRPVGKTNNKEVALLNTYLAGSPYARSHWRRQPQDMNTTDNLVRPRDTAGTWSQRTEGNFAVYGLQNTQSPSFLERQIGSSSGQPNAADVEPLLCVNIWPHVYLEQFGVAGKREYLEKWWDSVDWSKLSHRYTRKR